MITTHNIAKRFGKLWALQDINIGLEKGRSYALIGPNGSGKTTLIKCILGLVIPSQGELQFNGEAIKGNWMYREKIGYMPQIGRYPDNMKVGQLFEMIQNIRRKKEGLDMELYQALHLEAILDKRMHALSGGMRQKVSAALSFLFDPDVLILDEPTAGLDPVSVEILKDKIVRERERGKLIIITSHIMSDLDDLASEVIYMQEGQVRYNNSIQVLKLSTSEDRLGRAISALLKINNLTAAWA